jgi:hypothetical protein
MSRRSPAALINVGGGGPERGPARKAAFAADRKLLVEGGFRSVL